MVKSRYGQGLLLRPIPDAGLPLIGKLTSWPLPSLTKMMPRSCHAFRARTAKVVGPFLLDGFEVVMDEFLRPQ
jgi:hypothetical protein